MVPKTAKKATRKEEYVTEIPRCMKQLARMVVRGFYTLEDSLIIDLLNRHRCLKRVDIAQLLLLDKNMLRDRISKLRREKFIVTQKQRPHNYFIDYRAIAEVTNSKLMAIRKRLETMERTSFTSDTFRCTDCLKTFPELEADLLFRPDTQLYKCHFCGNLVQEISPTPPAASNSRLAPFNESMQPLLEKLEQVKGIRLAAHLMQPDAMDISTLRCGNSVSEDGPSRSPLFDFNFDTDDTADDEQQLFKEHPIWLRNSTIKERLTLKGPPSHTAVSGVSLDSSDASWASNNSYGPSKGDHSVPDSDTDDDLVEATEVPPSYISQVMI